MARLADCPPDCPPLTAATRGEGGVYYTPKCVGPYEEGAACLTAATARKCAYGQGDTCRPCPDGAVCPGGDRMWALPGHWQAEEPGPVVSCEPPAETRCTGWAAADVAATCGEGYDPDSPACTACLPEWYAESDGTCAPCPADGAETYRLLLYFVAVLVATFIVILAVILAVLRLSGGTLSGGVFRARDFVSYSVKLYAVLVQVARNMTTGPQELRDLYRRLTVLQFDVGGVIPAACLSSNPFFVHNIQLCVGLVLGCVWLALQAHLSISMRRGTASRKSLLGTLQRMTGTMVVLAFPLLLTTSLTVLNCVRRPFGADGADIAVVLGYGDVRCFQGVHRLPAGLAVCVLVVVCAAYPLLCLWLLARRWRVHRPSFVLADEPRRWRDAWQLFTNNDFPPHMFWFVLSDLGIIFVVATAGALLVRRHPRSVAAVGVASCVTAAVLWLALWAVLKHRPYVKRKGWKLPVKVLVLLVAALAAMLQLLLLLQDRDIGGAPVAAAATGMAWTVTVLVVALPFCFFLTFWGALVHGAKAEVRHLSRKAKRRRHRRASLKAATVTTTRRTRLPVAVEDTDSEASDLSSASESGVPAGGADRKQSLVQMMMNPMSSLGRQRRPSRFQQGRGGGEGRSGGGALPPSWRSGGRRKSMAVSSFSPMAARRQTKVAMQLAPVLATAAVAASAPHKSTPSVDGLASAATAQAAAGTDWSMNPLRSAPGDVPAAAAPSQQLHAARFSVFRSANRTTSRRGGARRVPFASRRVR